MAETIAKAVIWVLPIMVAVILHECAHGWVANRLGDPTAARMGRLTLNPLPHIDPLGTIVVPLLLIAMHSGFIFGWARPVPVNYRNLRDPKRDMVKVALAGPAMNLALAGVAALFLHGLIGISMRAGQVDGEMVRAVIVPLLAIAQAMVLINVVLAVFNMIPIPPLDGGRVLTGLLPMRQAVALARIEPYGMLIVVALLASQTLGAILGPAVRIVLQILGFSSPA